ncbi:FAD-binding domain-containing protein [Periconia macrospinosa]|uniref:FAD-binding domain-containing protein n=1 Tax=Periconia macrospinosa TaxID=97972 RepID=A0A2V1D5F2_9PLEO|nr:FAD-binding domain-containing protein [Periconia macrospinosa]
MEVVMVGVAWAANSLGNYLPLQGNSLNGFIERCSSQGNNFTADLAARLSPGAKISFPGEETFAEATARWSTFAPPNISINVEVAVEQDVVEVVRFANEHNKSYLAVNNRHGATNGVGKVKDGIQILMSQLNSVEVAADGQTATFGGGVLAKDVTEGLWAKNKQTVTGGCECVSLVGPGLGGGHGFLQGRHGLVQDQFVSLNLVTADGKLTKVDQNHELWWAVRGAGHNFGIVTSITSKVYDVVRPKWAYASFFYTGDKVESVYATINEKLLKNNTQEVEIINYSLFINDPTVDAANPIIQFFIVQEDTEIVDEKFTAPFTALGPAVQAAGGGDYRDLPTWTGNAGDQIFCQKLGLSAFRFPLELQVYDIAAQRKVYDLYNAAMKETPALNGSIALFEGYSMQGVQAVPAESSAYPFRESPLLVAPVIFFKEDTPELAQKAEALGTNMREILFEASGQPHRRVYVNYALGIEGPEEWYGAESWRQEKLKTLKKKYDPAGKFSFYNPIA